MKEVDMNQVPSSRTEEECMEEEEEEEDEISPNNGGGPARRKKLRLTKEQSRLLEESFRQNHTLNPVCVMPYIFKFLEIIFFKNNF